jgi:arginine deiminase
MYHASNSARIDEKIDHIKFIEELKAEKNKIEKKHASLLEELRKFSDDIEKKVIRQNYHKFKVGVEDEVKLLRKEVDELRQVQNEGREVGMGSGNKERF